MKQTVKDTGGVPAGETIRDLRREVVRSAPMGDQFDVTTRGAGIRNPFLLGAGRTGGHFRLRRGGEGEVIVGPGAVWAGTTGFYLWPGPTDAAGVRDVSGLDDGAHLVVIRISVNPYHGGFSANYRPVIQTSAFALWGSIQTDERVEVPVGCIEMLDGKVVRLSRWWTQPILLMVFVKSWRNSTANGVLLPAEKAYSYHCTLGLSVIGDPNVAEHDHATGTWAHSVEASINVFDFLTLSDT
jgi:hypothetical protein